MVVEGDTSGRKLLAQIQGMTELEREVMQKVFKDIDAGGFQFGVPGSLVYRSVILGREDAEFKVQEKDSGHDKSASLYVEDFYREENKRRGIRFSISERKMEGDVEYKLNTYLGDSESGHEITEDGILERAHVQPFLKEILLATPMIPDTAYQWRYLHRNSPDRNNPIQWLNPDNEGYKFDIVDFNRIIHERWDTQRAAAAGSQA